MGLVKPLLSTTSTALILFGSLGALLASRGAAADAPAKPLTSNCKMKTTFPDKSVFSDPCYVTILPAGQNQLAPKGMIQFMDAGHQVQVFSLNFFPPKEIKVTVPYALTTDTMESFLNGIVQPAGAHQLCRMTKKFPSTGTVTFTAVGKTDADFHGTIQIYPACYVNLGTPQQTLLPSGRVGGGTTEIVF
jgi:hypothetical protein